jgi:transcriptional regulator with XRE-family HTH domain
MEIEQTPDDAPDLEAIHEQTQGYFRAMGKRIHQMRRERRMSQKGMGRILGLSQQTVFNIEIGERRLRLDLIAVLARAFGVSADELLGIKPMPPLKTNPIAERLLRHLDTLQTLNEGDQRFILKLAEEMASR